MLLSTNFPVEHLTDLLVVFLLNAAKSSKTGLPVVIFVHGESYVHGSGNENDFGLFASLGNFVAVTLNYRLGLLGKKAVSNIFRFFKLQHGGTPELLTRKFDLLLQTTFTDDLPTTDSNTAPDIKIILNAKAIELCHTLSAGTQMHSHRLLIALQNSFDGYEILVIHLYSNITAATNSSTTVNTAMNNNVHCHSLY